MNERSPIGSLPLLATKLYRPPVTADVLPRPRLLELLDCNIYRPLTLISAPAGYGKTTLASMWLEDCGSPSAWVSLDEGDNDVRTFTQYVVAAIQGVFPATRLETQALLDLPIAPPVKTVARYLLNDLDRIQESFILALDDLHLVHEQAVCDLLAELLRHPSHFMRLLLISRRDPPLPIASLRAHGQVTEIRARDLRFETAETAQLLSMLLGRPVGETTAAVWIQRTEGWVTALQLAARSLRRSAEGDSPRAEIPAANRYLTDYLLAEVLAELPPDRRSCLMRMSILDRFCPALCEALCQPDIGGDGTPMSGEEFIAWLRNENVFVISLDEREIWYRLHHLFQQHLRRSLEAQTTGDEIAALHQQAGKWFEENGLWDEALRHLLASGDTAAAVDLVVRHRHELMNTQQWQRLEHWLKLLPAETVALSPYLMSIRSHLAVNAYSLETSEMAAVLSEAERCLAALSPEYEEYQVLRGEISANLSVMDILRGDSTRALAAARQSLQALPSEAILSRILASGVVAGGLQMQGRYGSGVNTIEELLADSGMSPHLRAYVLHILCIVRFLEGDLNGILTSGRDCLQIGETLKIPWMIGFARHHLGVVHYLRNELEEAETYLSALSDDRATVAASYLALGTIALALIHASRGKWAEAERVINVTSSELAEMRRSFAERTIGAFRVELAFRKEDLVQAQRLNAGFEFDKRPPSWFFYVPQLTPIRLLLAEGTRDSLAQARAMLEALDARMREIHRKMVRIDVLALLALVCDAQGDSSSATEALAEALLLAERGGFIRNFVDLGLPMARLLSRLQIQSGEEQRIRRPYIGRLLAAFPTPEWVGPGTPLLGLDSSSTRGAPVVIQPLTRRELQILRLLATELSPEEIASEIVVSTATVRSHTKSIYNKLDVHSRFEAVYRARELGLL